MSVVAFASAIDLEPYNIVWDSPSRDSLDSMPLSGRFGAGANVWVQDGSIWLYLARNDAYDEQGRLLKLGCVRITPERSFLGSKEFSQTLDLASGTISISDAGSKAKLWFYGDNLYIEFESTKDEMLNVDFGSWRDQDRDGIKLDVWGSESVKADHVEAAQNGLVWYHRNADYSSPLADLAKSQGIPIETISDPTKSLVFGGAVASNTGLAFSRNEKVRWQFWDGRAWFGKTKPAKRHRIAISLRSQTKAEPATWLDDAKALVADQQARGNRKNELARWKQFWNRSYIQINPNAKPDDKVWQVGRNYQLFRYMIACNRGGKLPLLFNGGIFTTDNVPGRIAANNNDELAISPGEPTTPDFRRWMGCRFMSQNQRWSGWPTVASGDADILAQSTAFYRDRSNVAKARAKGLGAEGVVYPEPLDIWGLPCVAPTSKSLCGATHLTYHYSMMLEHAWMGLSGYSTIGLPIKGDVDWMLGTIRFYDTFYRAENKRRSGRELDDKGKLVIYPSNGLELAYNATNPIETVAGLKRVIDGLLALPNILLNMDQRQYLSAVQMRIPDLPKGESNGKPILKFAEKHEDEYNKWELPELYAAWPYRLVGVTKPGTLEIARNTYEQLPEYRLSFVNRDFSWMPNAVNAAALGWRDESKKRILYKLNNEKAQARFPAFFGPGHDWLPDHNWGGSGMVALQEMLMASDPFDDGKIYLLPAWPMDWDVRFRLHAPRKTVVECEVKGGKIISLKVDPESRKKDVVVTPNLTAQSRLNMALSLPARGLAKP